MSLTPQIGRESQVQALGQTWTVGRFDVDVWDALLEWAQGRIPNPLEDLKPILKELDPHAAIQLIREAQATRPTVLTLENELFQKAIDGTVEGKVYRFWLLLKKHHPEVTRQQAFEILQEIGESKEQEALRAANGKNRPQRPKTGAVRRGASQRHDADQLAGSHPLPAIGEGAAPVGDQAADAARGR